MCNNLLKSLHRNRDVFPLFIDKLKCCNDILNHRKIYWHRNARQAGFEERTVSSSDSTVYKLYFKNTRLVIEKQINHTAIQDLWLEAKSARAYSHFMNSEICSKAVTTVKQKIKNSRGRTWRGKLKWEGEDIRLLTGCFQLFSAKSRTSLNDGSAAFYPLNIVWLDYSEKHQRRDTTSEKALCAYLPILVRRRKDHDDGKHNFIGKSVKHKEQFEKLNFFEHCMKALALL